MTRDDFFQPSEALGAKAGDFLKALAAEMVIPPGATQPQIVRMRLQLAVHILLSIAQNYHAAELNARGASPEDAGAEAKGFMTGIGIGIGSYLLTSAAPAFFLAHIADTAVSTIAMVLTTPPEGPKQ